MLIILSSIAFLAYLIYDFNPTFFNNEPHIDYLQAREKLEKKQYSRLTLSKRETFLRGEQYYILYLTENNGKKYQCFIEEGMEWKKIDEIIQDKKIEIPVTKHKHYFNIVTNLASACFSFVWMYYIGGNLFRQSRLTKKS